MKHSLHIIKGEIVTEMVDEIPPGDPYLILLFQLPENVNKQNQIQDTFFLNASFWQPYIAKMLMWTRPYALTKTETPDGAPALAMFVEFTDFEEILHQVGQEIAEELQVPAFAVTLTFLNDDMKEDLKESPRPWSETLSN